MEPSKGTNIEQTPSFQIREGTIPIKAEIQEINQKTNDIAIKKIVITDTRLTESEQNLFSFNILTQNGYDSLGADEKNEYAKLVILRENKGPNTDVKVDLSPILQPKRNVFQLFFNAISNIFHRLHPPKNKSDSSTQSQPSSESKNTSSSSSSSSSSSKLTLREMAARGAKEEPLQHPDMEQIFVKKSDLCAENNPWDLSEDELGTLVGKDVEAQEGGRPQGYLQERLFGKVAEAEGSRPDSNETLVDDAVISDDRLSLEGEHNIVLDEDPSPPSLSSSLSSVASPALSESDLVNETVETVETVIDEDENAEEAPPLSSLSLSAEKAIEPEPEARPEQLTTATTTTATTPSEETVETVRDENAEEAKPEARPEQLTTTTPSEDLTDSSSPLTTPLAENKSLQILLNQPILRLQQARIHLSRHLDTRIREDDSNGPANKTTNKGTLVNLFFSGIPLIGEAKVDLFGNPISTSLSQAQIDTLSDNGVTADFLDALALQNQTPNDIKLINEHILNRLGDAAPGENFVKARLREALSLGE